MLIDRRKQGEGIDDYIVDKSFTFSFVHGNIDLNNIKEIRNLETVNNKMQAVFEAQNSVSDSPINWGVLAVKILLIGAGLFCIIVAVLFKRAQKK